MQKFLGLKVLKSYKSAPSLWNDVRNQYQKIFENKPHIFKYSDIYQERALNRPVKTSRRLKDWKNTKADCREKSI